MKILRKRHQGSFFALLVKNYIAFTIVNVILFIFVIFTGLKVALSALNVPVTDPTEYLDSLKQHNYDEIDLVGLAGEYGRFEIVDSMGNVVYQKGNYKLDSGRYTPAELKLIPTGDSDPFEYQLQEYTTLDNKKKTLIVYIVNTVYEGLVFSEGGYDVYDDACTIVESSDPRRVGEKFLKREMFFSAGKLPDKNRIEKFEFIDADNDRRYLIIKSLVLDESIAIRTLLKSVGSFVLLFFLIYFLSILFFIVWLNRKVKKPLEQLNNAFLLFVAGKQSESLEYKGMVEFARINNSFNLLSEKLKTSEKERDELQKEKQRILADISHDFKTPITAIQGYTNAMLDGLIPEEEKGVYLEIISQKTAKLSNLVNLFNEYSQVEHPDFLMNFSDEDIGELLRAYIGQRYNHIVENGFEIEVDIQEDPINALVDIMQIERVFDNILFNVLKHNAMGTCIRVSMTQSKTHLEIRISDTGTGIAETIKKTLFKPFIVGDASRTKDYGSGLGLAIAYKIIERHKGEIYLNEHLRAPFKTEFVITLPISEAKSLNLKDS